MSISLLVTFFFLSLAISSWASDDLYYQEISFKSQYNNAEATNLTPLSTVWDKSPFSLRSLPVRGSIIPMFPEQNCVLAMSDGVLYGSSLKPHAEGLESPYAPWSVIDDSASGANIQIMVKSDDTIYAVSDDNVLKITFSHSSTEQQTSGCSTVHSIEKLLSEPAAWKSGEVTSLQYSSLLNSLFVGSDNGVYKIELDTDSRKATLLNSKLFGKSATTMLWVEEWKCMITANDWAVYIVFYCDDHSIVKTQHEFIEGLIGTTPTDMTYDSVNGWVWLAESECVHKLTRQLEWYRFGYQQLAPMLNVSTVTVQNNVVWVGSSEWGMARMWAATSPEQVDLPRSPSSGTQAATKDGSKSVFSDPGGDPWRWQYYYGPRWLTSNQVYNVISDTRHLYSTGEKGGDAGSSVWAVTAKGLTYISLTPYTLERKARLYATFQLPQHDRHGLSTSVGIAFGDRETYTKQVSDSDGLWTSQTALGQVYRHIAEPSRGSRELAWATFEGLERLSTLTPAYPKYAARSFCKLGDGTGGCPSTPQDAAQGWYNGTEEGWMYKSDTSSDEICGFLAAFPMLYDHIASTGAEKERVLALIEGITINIIEHDFFLIDPGTGQPTKWGMWNPTLLNDVEDNMSERGGNSLEICAWLASAYSITGKSVYKDTFWYLVNEHDFAYNILNVKIDSYVDENHSDTNLVMLAFHSMFYSLWRLSSDHERYGEVKEMVDVAVPGLQRMWLLLKGELDPLWVGIYAGTAGQTKYLGGMDGSGNGGGNGHGGKGDIIQQAVWSLRHWAIDGIQWAIQGSQRTDLDIMNNVGTFHVRGQPGEVVMRHIRPPSERWTSEKNLDPFAVNQGGPGGAGTQELEPGNFLLPYYIMKANGLI